MSITKKSGRQEVIVAHQDISLADLVGGFIPSGTVLSLGDLTVVGGSVTVEQAFNSTSTDC